MSIQGASVTHKLDSAGEFTVQLPLSDPRTAEALPGRIWKHYVEGEGLAFAGQIETRKQQPEDTLEISGPTLLQELLYKNTLLNRQYSMSPLGALVDDLLSGTGWTRLVPGLTTLDLAWELTGQEGWALGALSLKPAAGSSISRDSSSSANANSSSLVWPHTVAAGGKLLLVAVSVLHATRTVSTVYWGSQALTHVGSVLLAGVTLLEVWARVNPTAGVQNVTVTLAGGSAIMSAGASSWLGVDTAGASYGALASATGVAGTAALVVPTQPSEVVTDFISVHAHVDVQAQGGRQQIGAWYESPATMQLCASSCDWRAAAITARFDGESKLKAILDALGQQALHLRERVSESGGVLVRGLEAGVFGMTPSGVTLMGGYPDELLFDDDLLAAVESLSIEETSSEIWNWVLPLGAGDGVDQLTLHYSTRRTPYAVQNVVGPDGKPVYYIADAASISAYGQRERAFVAKDIAPLSNNRAALEVAANALYDLAAAQMAWYWKDKQSAYRLTARGLPASLIPGDTVRLRWRGYAEHASGGYVYLDVDDDLYVLERTRRWAKDGTETSELVVSGLDRALQTTDEVLIGKVEDTARSFRTHVQTSVSNYTSGPILEDLDSTHPLVFDVLIDDNVAQLLRCRLRLKLKPVRSSSKAAAYQPSNPWNVLSDTPYSEAGYLVYGTAEGHIHCWLNFEALDGDPADPVRKATVFYWGNHVSMHYWGSFQAGVQPTGTATSLPGYGLPPAWITAAGQFHRHQVNLWHGHDLEWGIYEGSVSSSLTLKIDGTDVTSALGGPWNATALLDITQYLQEADGVVERGSHTLEIGSSTLGRVEAWVDWTVAAQAIVAS